MALRVWLPLNKDLRNQGVDDAKPTSSNVTFSNDGVIGGSVHVAGTSKRVSIPSSAWMRPTNENSFSVSMFVKATTFDYLIAAEAFEIRLLSNSIMFRIGNGGANVTATASVSMSSSAGKWYHICGTWDASDKKVSVYRDGELAASGNSTVTTFNNISSTVNLVYGGEWDICDFRMYDHSLSAKEVKEISKALVLHYKLDETYGMINMAAGKTSTCYNNYGTGMTYTKTDLNESYMGQKVYRWTYKMVNDSCVSGFKSGYHSRGIYGSPTYFGESGSNLSFVYWIYYRPQTSGLTAGGTASNIGGWTEIPREYVGDGWWRVGQYRTNNTSTRITTDNIFTSLNWPYAGVGSSCTIDFVEMGWLLSGTTSIPSNFIDGNSVVHDCSGYGNDGTIGGLPKPITGSPRYETATSLAGSSYINAGRGSMVTNALTVAVWAHSTAWASAGRIASCTEGGGWNFENGNGYLRFPVYAGDYSLATDTLPLSSYSSGWHHIVGTFDGPSKKNCFYRDGQFIASATTINSAMTYYSNNSVFIGAEAAASQTTPQAPYFNGYVSDFRIYGTALSPEDVAELYHTAASVDNKGNFYCYELKEI